MPNKPIIPYSENQKNAIVKNVVAACSDIELLKPFSYKFLYLCSGFIAHYNFYGFVEFYRDYSLREDIIENARANQWMNFRPGDEHYDYYMSKKDIYNRIVAAIQ